MTRRRLAFVILRASLLVVGVVAIAVLVRDAGSDLVVRTIVAAGPWLPALVALEIGVASLDALAVRALHGERGRDVPASVWVRSTLVAVATAQFLPGGRVLGEVTRAASLSPHVGPARGAAVAILAHGTYLWSIALASAACWLCVAKCAGGSALLEGLILWSACFTFGLGSLFVLGPRIAPVGTWLGRRIGLLEVHGPALDRALAEAALVPVLPLGLYVLARLTHVLSAGLLFVAVGVAWDARGAFVGEAVQLVAANVGDAVPGQTGVTEAAYRLFAPSLGLGQAVAAAVAMALVIRVARVGLGTASAAVAALWRRPDRARIRSGTALTLLVLAALASSAGRVSAQAVEDDPGARVVVHQRLVGVVNPTGLEHMLALGVRFPLGDPESPLFDGAHLELGVVEYLSPVYSMTGGYAELSPLAFLILRAEVSGVVLWPIGMDGAGYYPVDGYDADVQAKSLPGASGGTAAGVRVELGATLQLAVQLGPLRPIVWSQLTVEHERIGEEPFHYSPKYDLVLRRSDWMVASTTMLLLEVALGERLRARVGAYDDLRHVPSSGYLAHQIGPTAMLAVEPACGAMRELLFFGRAGTFMDPDRRRGDWTALVGVIARYDLGAL